jgi:hypothetical protein
MNEEIQKEIMQDAKRDYEAELEQIREEFSNEEFYDD